MKLQRYLRLFILLAILTTGMVLIYTSSSNNGRIRKLYPTVSRINSGWTLDNKGQIIQSDNITNSNIGVVNENEKVILSKKLDAFTYDNPCISFYTIQAIVNVYLDYEKIYSFGQDYYDRKSSVPSNYNLIHLGSEYKGKTITIELTGSKNNCFSGLSDIYVGTISDLFSHTLYRLALPISVGLFLFTLGIILIILSPYLFIFHNQDLRIFFSGLISLMLSIYILAFNGIFALLVGNPLLNTVLEYTALYNIPTVLVGYLMSSYSGRSKKIFFAMFILDVFLFLSSIVLHFTHIFRFSDFTMVLHIAAGIEFVFVFYVIVKSYRSRKNEAFQSIYSAENVFVFGLIAFMSLCMIEIIRYNLLKYGPGPGETSATLFGFTIGALIFVACLMVSYLFYNIFSPNIDNMQSHIKDLAYTDALTGLSNRASCEQMMNMLSEQNGTYAIISLDLNRLKQINDTLGHHEGDRLLTGFATILSDCFWDANLIGRMGGDEFIVIMLEERTANLTKRLHELYSLIGEWNHKEINFSYSAAYGYAYSHEVPHGSAKEVYMLADNRMYEMKREQHENKINM